MRSHGPLTTQKDVAKLAGVSQAVVSAVLAGNTRNIGASPDVTARIQEAAQRLNYRPNLSARSMRHGRFFNIGYFAATKDFNEFDYAPIRAGVYDAASEQGYHVMMIRLPSHRSKDPEVVPKTFREAHLDAMIINAVSIPINTIKEVVGPTLNLPIVYLNCKETNGSVYVDDYLGGRLATEHLYAQGYRRIAYFSADASQLSDHYSTKDRIEGYTEFMAEHGLVAQIKRVNVDIYEEHVVDGISTPVDTKGFEVLADWLKSPNRPEAVVCYSDHMAMTLIQTLYKLGLRVPDDMAVTGYNDEPVAYLSASPLTTIHVPHYEMAVASVNMAIAMIKGESDRLPSSMKFGPRLIARQSSNRRVAPVAFQTLSSQATPEVFP